MLGHFTDHPDQGLNNPGQGYGKVNGIRIWISDRTFHSVRHHGRLVRIYGDQTVQKEITHIGLL